MLRIKAERLRRRWTQTDLAYHARVQPAEISRIESGKAQPYPKQAERLARALKLKPHQLLEDVAAPAA